MGLLPLPAEAGANLPAIKTVTGHKSDVSPPEKGVSPEATTRDEGCFRAYELLRKRHGGVPIDFKARGVGRDQRPGLVKGSTKCQGFG
jgi:hypothetical protein